MSLSKKAVRYMEQALPEKAVSDEVIGDIGIWGGFQLGAAGAVATTTGDISVQAQAGVEAGSYRVRFNGLLNSQVQALKVFNVSGFTPRAPQTQETAQALVSGYSKDASGWYVTIVVADMTGAIMASPPTGFAVGFEAKVQMQAQRL